MRIGFSGRPLARLKVVGVPTVMNRLVAYAHACMEEGMHCLEVPMSLICGKCGPKDQFIATCTEYSEEIGPPELGAHSLNLLVRARQGMVDMDDRPTLDYARRLVALYGAKLLTVDYRHFRGRLPNMAQTAGAPIGLILDWSDPNAVEKGTSLARSSRDIYAIPLISLTRQTSQVSRTIARALSVCGLQTAEDARYLFLNAEGHLDPEIASSISIAGSIAETCLEHESQAGSELSVVFVGLDAREFARQLVNATEVINRRRRSVDGSARPFTPRLGSRVKIRDLELGTDMEYSIVRPQDASTQAGRLSSDSPVAMALLGKPCGTRVEVRAPGGKVVYELLDVHDDVDPHEAAIAQPSS